MVDTAQSVGGGFGFLTDLMGIQMRNMEAIQQAQQKMPAAPKSPIFCNRE